MSFRTLFALGAASLLALLTAQSQDVDAATTDGLISVRSWNLDELYLRPNTDLASYRSVIIDPVQVSFRKDWNHDFVDPHASIRRLSQDDVRRIADETASGLQTALADAFRARGYAIGAAPGPGVLRLSPTLTNVYVNAVEDLYTGGTTKSFTKDAGEATLVLEVRDAGNGALLGRVVDRRTAQETKGTQRGDLIRSPRVASNFWFEDLFRKWSAATVKELEATRKS
jgi:uncharacterized protein DUF3313